MNSARSHLARTAARAPRASRSLRAIAVAAALCATAIAGCGDGDDGTDDPQRNAASPASQSDPGEPIDISGTEPVGQELAGSVALSVTCGEWKTATPDERLATIEDVRSQINLEDSGISAPELTDEEAENVFDDACRPNFAVGFRLYKLYARAAGFVELKREIKRESGG